MSLIAAASSVKRAASAVDGFGPEHHAIAVTGHRRAMRAADHLVQGQPCDLARNIPKRDINAGQGLQRHPLLSVVAHQVVNLVPDDIAVHRVHAQHHGLDDLFNDAFVGDRDVARSETLAPAGDALVGLDLDKMRRAAVIVLL
jgi:hypothetical protein